MTFTAYTGALSTDLERVRFHTGDTVSGSGPKPEDGNFTDEEIAGVIELEGTWQRAVANLFETLAGLWTKHATFSAQGMQMSQSDIADGFRASALVWRDRYGDTPGGAAAGMVPITRVDGYSDDLDNVTLEDSE